MDVTDSGIVILANELQDENAYVSMDVTVFGMVIDANEMQFSNE